MTTIDQLLAHYRNSIAQLRADAADFQSGRFRLYDGPGCDREVTNEWAARKAAQADKLEEIVGAYEAKKNG